MSKRALPEITSMSDQAIDWIILLNSGNATEQDKTNAGRWQRSREHERAYREAEALWQDMGDVMARENVGSVPRQQDEIAKPRQFVRWGWTSGVAVTAILLLLITPFSRYSDQWLSDYSTGVGDQQLLTLADGSTIRLNTDSAIAVRYTQNSRQIRLYRGQAIFSVAADARRPFEVVTDDALVRALGTVFEVWDDGGNTYVTVIEHAVSLRPVSKQSGRKEIRIAEGQQAGYGNESGWQQPVSVDVTQYTAWQRGKLIFKNRTLGEVITELGRYSPGRIIITDEKISSLKVSGVFPVREADKIPDMIGKMLPVKILHLSPWLTVLYSS